MVRGLDKCVDLPNFVNRKSETKGRHLRPLATVDHRRKDLIVGEFRLKNVWSACACALMTNEALASIDIATGGNGIGLPVEGISQTLPCVRDLRGDKPRSKTARLRMKRARADP